MVRGFQIFRRKRSVPLFSSQEVIDWLLVTGVYGAYAGLGFLDLLDLPLRTIGTPKRGKP